MEPIIDIRSLSFTYEDHKQVLKNIDLEIDKGEIFGIIGPTGAGKSTLLLHLNGLLKGEGELQVKGIPVTEKNEKEVRSQVGIVFQNPDNQLFCPTVYEDIAFGLYNSGYDKEQVKKKAIEILERLNLLELKDLSSHHLSFGEKKRVSLASILVMEPEILCFDEPFANLDYSSIFTIVEEIKRLDITRIVVSQDILLALSLCNRIAVMNRGEILRVAPAEEIARDHRFLEDIGIDFKPYLEMVKSFL